MNIIINLILIQFIIVNIIDISGIIQSIEAGLSKWLKKKAHIPKPIGCSYCTTWWTGLIYLIISGNVTLYYLAALLIICYLTQTTRDIIYLIGDTITTIINYLNKIN